MPHNKNTKVINFSDAVSFRTPIEITEIMLMNNGNMFPVCPNCKITLEREFQRYCDRCGQSLNWKHYNKAHVINQTK